MSRSVCGARCQPGFTPERSVQVIQSRKRTLLSTRLFFAMISAPCCPQADQFVAFTLRFGDDRDVPPPRPPSSHGHGRQGAKAGAKVVCDDGGCAVTVVLGDAAITGDHGHDLATHPLSAHSSAWRGDLTWIIHKGVGGTASR